MLLPYLCFTAAVSLCICGLCLHIFSVSLYFCFVFLYIYTVCLHICSVTLCNVCFHLSSVSFYSTSVSSYKYLALCTSSLSAFLPALSLFVNLLCTFDPLCTCCFLSIAHLYLCANLLLTAWNCNMTFITYLCHNSCCVRFVPQF